MRFDQIIAIVFIVLLILNTIFFAMKLISITTFWIILGVGFLVSYSIKKINEKK